MKIYLTHIVRFFVLLLVLASHALAVYAISGAPTSKPVVKEELVIQGVLITAPMPVVESQAKPTPQAKNPPPPRKKPKPVKTAAPKPTLPLSAEQPTDAIAVPLEASATEVEEAIPSDNAPERAIEEAPPVVPPRVDAGNLDNPIPAYPHISRRLGEVGTVLLEILILPDGTVGEARIQTSSGFKRLDNAALAAVKSWRYTPARRGNEAISYWYKQPVSFTLD